MATLGDDEGAGKYADENRGDPLQPPKVNAKWQQECRGCHIAYPPGLLPAESWRRVMSGLENHFGADATLLDEEAREIAEFLVANASNRWTAPTAPLRITESRWFLHRHEKKVSAAVWRRPPVKTPANCPACHAGADKGEFNEKTAKVPD